MGKKILQVALLAILAVSVHIIWSGINDCLELMRGNQKDGNTILDLDEAEKHKIFLFQEGIRFGLKPKDIRILSKIAKAESGWKHYDSNGNVLVGKINPNDIGIFQINKKFHLEKAKEMGLDIYLPLDNIKFAIYLYSNEGTKPWSWSKKNWSK
jgi:hypothetical protein